MIIVAGSMEAGTKEWSWSGSWKPVERESQTGHDVDFSALKPNSHL